MWVSPFNPGKLRSFFRPLRRFCSSPPDPTPRRERRPRSSPSPAKIDSFISDYLQRNFSIPESRILTLPSSVFQVSSPEKPDAVIRLLRRFGLSDADIAGSVRVCPQILSLHAERTIEPKLRFLCELGFAAGPELGTFISKSSSLLTCSLSRRLVPAAELINGVLPSPDSVARAIRRCHWIIKEDPLAKLAPNLSFLRDLGVTQQQLASLMTTQPSIFIMRPPALRGLVDRAVEAGFSSRMLVYRLLTLAGFSEGKLRGKFDVLRGFGFSEEELRLLFRRSPALLRTSEEKLRSGQEFFLVEAGVGGAELLRHPAALMYSMERRTAPPYRVLRALQFRGIATEEKIRRKFVSALVLTGQQFLDMYVFRYSAEAPELLGEYTCREPDSKHRPPSMNEERLGQGE